MSDNAAYVTLTDANFDQEVLQSDVPVLVDFWATWCPPCKAQGPIIETVAETYAGRVKVAKLNVDQAPRNAARYAVQSIPTLLCFATGEYVERLVGLKPDHELGSALAELLQSAS